MKLRTLKRLPIATANLLAALALVAISATIVSAADNRANLGPVGPHEPILATIGGKRLIAYYEQSGEGCAVSAVVFDTAATGGGHESTRVRVILRPGELFQLEAVENEQVVLTCGPKARILTVLNRGELLTKAASVN
jgi:hypothetical protein